MTPAEIRLLEFVADGVQQEQRLHQFVKYAVGVYRLKRVFLGIADGRRAPAIKTFSIVNALFMAAVLRVPSINQLEEMLAHGQFQKLLGYPGKKTRGKKLFSADTITDVLDTLDLTTLHAALVQNINLARDKDSFVDDTYGSHITVALDGWEPFCSYERHCPACLTRMVKKKVKDENGDEIDTKVKQYYHRYVVAFLVAPKLDLTLAIEPVYCGDQRHDDPDGTTREDEASDPAGPTPKKRRDEGELTAALRLIDRLKQAYGCFIDVFALDGLYPCGPVLTKLKNYNYGACIITRDKRKDPLRFADSIWEHKTAPDQVIDNEQTGEKTEFWLLRDVDALSTFDGSVDMVKARVTNKKGKVSTWAWALVGKAKRMKLPLALRVMRARWHIENTAFHQWVTKWNLDHCYRHTDNAITALLHIFALAFNLFQLFFYRRLRKPRTGRKPTDTLIVCVKQMWIDLGSLREPVPWFADEDRQAYRLPIKPRRGPASDTS